MTEGNEHCLLLRDSTKRNAISLQPRHRNEFQADNNNQRGGATPPRILLAETRYPLSPFFMKACVKHLHFFALKYYNYGIVLLGWASLSNMFQHRTWFGGRYIALIICHYDDAHRNDCVFIHCKR